MYSSNPVTQDDVEKKNQNLVFPVAHPEHRRARSTLLDGPAYINQQLTKHKLSNKAQTRVLTVNIKVNR
jgi:hypothetical protein